MHTHYLRSGQVTPWGYRGDKTFHHGLAAPGVGGKVDVEGWCGGDVEGWCGEMWRDGVGRWCVEGWCGGDISCAVCNRTTSQQTCLDHKVHHQQEEHCTVVDTTFNESVMLPLLKRHREAKVTDTCHFSQQGCGESLHKPMSTFEKMVMFFEKAPQGGVGMAQGRLQPPPGEQQAGVCRDDKWRTFACQGGVVVAQEATPHMGDISMLTEYPLPKGNALSECLVVPHVSSLELFFHTCTHTHTHTPLKQEMKFPLARKSYVQIWHSIPG